MTELERLREKAAQKRLKLEYEHGGSGVHHYRLRDTKHGTLAFHSNRSAEAEEFIDQRRLGQPALNAIPGEENYGEVTANECSRLKRLEDVNVEDLELTRRLDARLLHPRPKLVGEGLLLLRRFPDLAHANVVLWSEANM